MFDKLIDVLVQIWDKIWPIHIVKQYENGVHLRNGKVLRVVEPGMWFKFPYFDEIHSEVVVITTLKTNAQSVITKDGKKVVVKSMIKYKSSDVSKFYTDVYDAKDAMVDTTMGWIRKLIKDYSFQEIMDADVDNEITKKVRADVKKWGIEITSITLTDLSQANSIRLFNEQIIDD